MVDSIGGAWSVRGFAWLAEARLLFRGGSGLLELVQLRSLGEQQPALYVSVHHHLHRRP